MELGGVQGLSVNLPTLRMLGEYLDKPVLVRLKGGVGIKGELKTYDQHLNIVLSNAEEISDQGTRRLGLVLIRGDTVAVISPAV